MIHFVTIVLDGMPWIGWHLPVFNCLPMRWHWHIIEGVADPVKDTAWCKPIPPRLSQDGTKEYLDSIAHHPNISIYRKELWHGKTEMFNYALDRIKEPGLLWQVDADELWTAEQINIVRSQFDSAPKRNCADFWCRYFVGPDIVVERIPGTWTNADEIMWRRVWRFQPGMRFASHEPPVLENHQRNPIPRAWLPVFDHYAYATEAQVAFKEQYYGYTGAVEGWRRLQSNTRWPCRLGEFLPWLKNDGAMANKLFV